MELTKYDTSYRRFFAKIFDYVLLISVLWIISALLPQPSYSFDFNNPNPEKLLTKDSGSALDIWTEYNDLIKSFLVISYFVLFHFFAGQTVGKMIANVKVWNIDETKKLSFLQAILRNLSDICFVLITFIFNLEYLPIILILVWTVANLIQVFSNKKLRTIDDLIAKTVVIRIFDNDSEEHNI